MIMDETRRVDRSRIDAESTLALLRVTGLTGHGGGAFPTATKISSAAGGRPRLIINACDGEPLVHKDTTLLQHRPLLVADGIAVVQRLVAPRRTLIAVHAGSVGETAAAGLLRHGDLSAELLPIPDRYVSSEASALVSAAAGGPARPIYHDEPLTSSGPGRRRPTLVLNAETVARIAAILIRGAALPTRLVTLAGDVGQPGLREAGLSTPIQDLILGAGPTRVPRAVLVGGYGGRWFGWSELTGQTLGSLGRAFGAGLLMIPSAGCPLRQVSGILGYLAGESAGRCGPCMFGLPAIAADWSALTDPQRSVEAADRLRRRLPTLGGRGACAHPDGAVTMAATALTVFAADLHAHQVGACVAAAELAGVR